MPVHEVNVQTCRRYDELVARAVRVVIDAPYWEFVSESNYTRVSINGDEATLFWPEVEFWCEGGGIERRDRRFPAALLVMSDVELSAWKQDEKEKSKREDKEKQLRLKKRADEDLETEDRATYERLKLKYHDEE